MSRQCPAPEIHALGEVMGAFGSLEFFLELTLWTLLGEGGKANMTAKAFTAQMSFRARVSALGAGVRIKHPELPEGPLDSLVKDLVQAEEGRNTLAHSAWHYEGGPGTLVRIKVAGKQKGTRHRIQHMPTAKIEAIRDQILAVTKALGDYTLRHLQGGKAHENAG